VRAAFSFRRFGPISCWVRNVSGPDLDRRQSARENCWGSFFPIVKKDPHHQQILPPSPRIASAPAVSAGAADAGKARAGVRGHSSSDRPRCRQLRAPNRSHKTATSIQPQKLNSAKISFSNLGPWRISLNAASNATNGKTCPRRAVGMAPGVFAHDPNGSISDVPESAARMTA
jgi:hypothetical protein